MKKSIRVIEVIDHYQVKINLGSNQGASPGDEFAILKAVNHEHFSEEIVKGVGKAITVNAEETIIKSVQQKTGGKKEIIKTGSGEAFIDAPHPRDDSTTVDPESNPLPFNQVQTGDRVKLLHKAD